MQRTLPAWLAAAALCAAGAAPPARAATAAFTAPAEFLATAVSPPEAVDFEAFATGLVPPASFLGPLAFFWDPGAFALAIGDTAATTSPVRSLGTASEDAAFVGGDTLAIGLARTVQAVALSIVVEEPGLEPGFFAIETTSGATAASGDALPSLLADGGRVHFVGVADEAGFNGITLTSAATDDLPFTVDDVVLVDLALVPEPGAAAQAVAAGAGLALGGLRLRRR